MNLTNMAMSAEERREYATPTAVGGAQGPQYPYGLCITLDGDAVDKLGIALPPVGATMMLMARVTVERTATLQENDGEVERTMSLQITDMALTEPETDARAFYSNSEMQK